MAEILSLTPEEKRALLFAVNNKHLCVDANITQEPRLYTISKKSGQVIYSIEAYNNQRRVVKYDGKTIADSATFGSNIVLLREINYILSLLIARYTQELNTAIHSGKHR